MSDEERDKEVGGIRRNAAEQLSTIPRVFGRDGNRLGSTENAGPELGGPNKTKGRNVRVENGGPILNTGKCRTGNCRTGKMEDHFTGLKNAGPEKEDRKESGWKLKDHSRSYNKAEHLSDEC